MNNIVELYTNTSDVISFFANICVLGITIYTFYLTAFCRKIVFVSIGFSASMFYGESISISLSNKSLHAIPVTEVFFMKKIDGEFCRISLQKYDNPIVIEPWHIQSIHIEPFTKMLSPSDEKIDLADIHMDAVIGVSTGEKNIIWVKPYKKAPIRQAKKSYRKRNFDIITVARMKYDEDVLSENVNYIVHVKNEDVNGNVSWENVYVLCGEGGLIFSKNICGHTGLSYKGNITAKKVKKCICKQLKIPKDAIYVEDWKALCL